MRFAKFINTQKIKKQLWRKGAVLGAVGLLAIACSGTTVMAASTVSGTLNGYGCHGYVDVNQTSAYGATTCGRGSATMKVEVTVYYKFDETVYRSVAYGSNTSGGAGATATKKKGGADVIGGKGIHSVSFGAYSWGVSEKVKTTIGTIPPSSKLI